MTQNSDDLIAHYQALLAKNGPSPEAVQYSDKASQENRFEVLRQVVPDLTSVLDVGCGLGDLWSYLRTKGETCSYTGVDIVPEFAKLANQAMADDPTAQVHHLTPGAPLPRGHEVVMLSGVFNNLMDDNWGFMTAMLRQMWAAADTAIAFNAMTDHVDYHDPGLYYVDPMKVFQFCKQQLGGHPVLRHDYVLREGGFPFEFAMYVYKSPVTIG